MNTTVNFLSLSWCIWAAALFLLICFMLGTLWLPGEPKEDEGDAEELDVCVLEQFSSSGPRLGWKKVGHP